MTRQLDSYDAFCFETLRNHFNRPTTGDVECACRSYLLAEGYTDMLVTKTRSNPTT